MHRHLEQFQKGNIWKGQHYILILTCGQTRNGTNVAKLLQHCSIHSSSLVASHILSQGCSTPNSEPRSGPKRNVIQPTELPTGPKIRWWGSSGSTPAPQLPNFQTHPQGEPGGWSAWPWALNQGHRAKLRGTGPDMARGKTMCFSPSQTAQKVEYHCSTKFNL